MLSKLSLCVNRQESKYPFSVNAYESKYSKTDESGNICKSRNVSSSVISAHFTDHDLICLGYALLQFKQNTG